MNSELLERNKTQFSKMLYHKTIIECNFFLARRVHGGADSSKFHILFLEYTMISDLRVEKRSPRSKIYSLYF